jgi:glycosyltransferase involved in cell wall biosynthesis
VRRSPGLQAAWDRLRGALLRPEIALFHRFVRGPWGGSNQFFGALRGELRRRGHRVSANLLGPGTRAALLNAFAFDAERLRRLRRPGLRVVQRVDGPVGRYRGEGDAVDREVAALNAELCDATVFQSRYCQQAHAALGLPFREPRVVLNAVDPGIFHPRGRRAPAGKLRLIATSWSDNPNKGAATHAWLEEHLDFTRWDFTFVGRSTVPFRRVRALAPLPPGELAGELREHDVYLAASLHDPCSNALLEGLACGLPAIYARSGGHPELVGEAGLGFDDLAELPGLLERMAREHERLRARIAIPSLREVADQYLDAMGLAPRRAV